MTVEVALWRRHRRRFAEQLLDHGGHMRLEGFDLDVGEVLEEIHDRLETVSRGACLAASLW